MDFHSDPGWEAAQLVTFLPTDPYFFPHKCVKPAVAIDFPGLCLPSTPEL